MTGTGMQPSWLPVPVELDMPKAKRPIIGMGPFTVRALAGAPGAWRWRAEWYPPGGSGKMKTVSLARVRGERFDRDEAISRVAELLAAGRHLEGPEGARPERKIETVRDLLELWLGLQKRRVGVEIRATTWDTYRVACARLVRTGRFGAVLLDEVTEAVLRRCLGRLHARYAGRTLKLTHNILTLAWKWGVEEGYCGPLPKVRPKLELRTQRMPSLDEVESTLEGMAAHIQRGRCAESMQAVRLLLGTGARPGELALAHVEHVNLRGRTWTVRSSKTGERQVPLNADCMELLRQLIGTRSAGPLWERAPAPSHQTALAPSNQKTLARCYQTWGKWVAIGCETAGVAPWTLKGLRHLACTRMLASGIDVATAASITGHTPAVLLATYAHVLEHRRQAAVAALARPSARVIPFPQREVKTGP